NSFSISCSVACVTSTPASDAIVKKPVYFKLANAEPILQVKPFSSRTFRIRRDPKYPPNNVFTNCNAGKSGWVRLTEGIPKRTADCKDPGRSSTIVEGTNAGKVGAVGATVSKDSFQGDPKCACMAPNTSGVTFPDNINVQLPG